MISCLVSLAMLSQATTPLRPVQIIVLMSTQAVRPTDQKELNAAQLEHLNFLQSLIADGKASAVGPFADSGRMRGLVFVDHPTRQEALTWVKQDPLCRRGWLEPVALTWLTQHQWGKLGEFMDVESLWFCFLKKGQPAQKYTQAEVTEISKGHMAHLGTMVGEGILRAAGPLEGGSNIRGILVMAAPKREDVVSAVARDPAVKAGLLKLEIHRWMTTKGGFPELPKGN